MKIIKYFNKELVKTNKIKEKVLINKPTYEIKQLNYKVSDIESKKWYDIIKKTYGEYGEVTIEDGGTDAKSAEQLQTEINAKLLKDSANLQIELDKQKELNTTLLMKIAKLGGR